MNSLLEREGLAGQVQLIYIDPPYGVKYGSKFLLRLVDGRMLILEVKGQDDDEQRTKRQFLDEWVRAVNTHGGFGAWAWAVSRRPLDVLDILEAQSQPGRPAVLA
jgi:type III restriction enzyme